MPMTPYSAAVQALGLVGLLFGILAFQNNKHKNIVLLKLLNEFFFAVQYILLGAYTGAVMNLISCVRNYIYCKSVEAGKPTIKWVVLFSVIIAAAGIMTWSSALSLVPILAKLLTTVAYGMKDTKKVRFLTLPSSLCWLFYNALYHSAGGVINEVFTTASILIAVVRFDILSRKKPRS
ncbi:MAG: YgjV family protein [Clostridia bacterium]|nr:YgjV family protein [Clostridia bacterium]